MWQSRADNSHVHPLVTISHEITKPRSVFMSQIQFQDAIKSKSPPANVSGKVGNPASWSQLICCRLMLLSHHVPGSEKRQTLWFLPCLSRREIMDLMWFSWMMFKTSGLSISTQYSTSRIPKRIEKRNMINS